MTASVCRRTPICDTIWTQRGGKLANAQDVAIAAPGTSLKEIKQLVLA